MPEFSITFCCDHVHTMFRYVVLWYAEEISLSLSLSLSLFEGPFYLKNVLYVPFSVCLVAFVNCSNKITLHFQHLFTSFIFAPKYRE